MRFRYLAPAALALLVIAAPSHADTGFSATINSAQEVPVNASTATGSGTFVLNTAQTQLSFVITENVVNETAAHIHGPAAPGVNAGVLFPLPAGPTKTGVWAIDPTSVGYLMNGLLYVNIHSTLFPGGEIRGQILPDVVPTTATTWGRIKSIYR